MFPLCVTNIILECKKSGTADNFSLKETEISPSPKAVLKCVCLPPSPGPLGNCKWYVRQWPNHNIAKDTKKKQGENAKVQSFVVM